MIHYNRSVYSFNSVYDIIGDSKTCTTHYRTSLNEDASEFEPVLCPPGIVTVNLAPIVRLSTGNTLPHVELNISVVVYEMVDSVTLHFECLHAPNGEDIYCHNPKKMVVDGEWMWPCRAVTFRKKEAVQIPFRVGYSCFRLYELSQYLVNVTLLPQKCRASLLITSPLENQLSPHIAEFYSHVNISSPHWSPALIVDLSDQDGVWLRVEGPGTHYARTITISLFERLLSGAVRLMETFHVEHPTTGVKWQNAPNGDYVVYAYIPRHDCLLLCDSLLARNEGCHPCVHTYLNFSLHEERTSVSWKSLRAMRDSGNEILLAVLAIIILMVIGSAIFFLYHHCQSTPDLRDVELVERYSVLIIYCDDCEEHSSVVFQLSQLLQRCAKAVVLLDQNELNAPGVRPSRWLIDSMCRANRVIIVISPCSQLVLDGKVLQQRRPFPDLFAAAVNMIIRECTIKAVNDRFAICRLPYSPETPDQLSILGIQEFLVPSNMHQLTAFIHKIDLSSDVQQSFDPQLFESFLRSVDDMKIFMKTNIHWMQQRFVNEDLDGVVKLYDVPNRVPVLLDTKEKREKAAEEFGLLPPDENELSDIDVEFTLLPPDSSDSEN